MKITNFLICDDIRVEMGNKHSLIGIYDDVIEFNVTAETKNKWPKVMKIGIFAKVYFESKDTDLKSFKLKIEYNKKIIDIAQGILPADLLLKSHRLSIVIVHNNFVFIEVGEIKFIFDFYNEKNQIIETISPDYKLKVSEKLILNI